jgi:Flp pilus assembly protein TadB
MTAAVLAGVGLAAGLCLLVSGFAPRPARLDRALARLGQPVQGPLPTEPEAGADLDARLGHWLRRFPLVDRAVATLAADLRILGRSPDHQVAQLVAYGLVGLFWAPVVTAGCLLLGVRVPVAVPLWLAVAGAVVMVFVPFRQVRNEAIQARAGFAHALSAFCDVAAMALSAGLETHRALFEAAAAGSGTAFDELNNALQIGFLAGQSPAESLQQLGRDLGIDDLVDLGGTIALAETEGAPVGETIGAKARSIRERLINDIERTSASATERMAIPGAMLMIGFLWFIAFPALYLIFQEAH